MSKKVIEPPDIQRAKFLSELTERIQYWTLNSNPEYVDAYMTLLCSFSMTPRLQATIKEERNEDKNSE